jgi:hypothetical protein
MPIISVPNAETVTIKLDRVAAMTLDFDDRAKATQEKSSYLRSVVPSRYHNLTRCSKDCQNNDIKILDRLPRAIDVH